MRLIRSVFNALKTFDRPATRRELERETGLCKDDVHAGLRGLSRRNLVIKEVAPRRGGTYRLVARATMPEDLRGGFVRDAAYCERLRRAYLGYHASRAPTPQPMSHQVAPQRAPMGQFNAASPPAPSNAPGGLRTVVKGILDVPGVPGVPRCEPTISSSTCALADFWKKR